MSGDACSSGCIDLRCRLLCGLCSAVCPPMAISDGAGGVRLDRSVCTGCGACSDVCPAGLIAGDLTATGLTAADPAGGPAGDERIA